VATAATAGSGLGAGSVSGIVVGAVVLIAIIAIVVAVLLRRRRKPASSGEARSKAVPHWVHVGQPGDALTQTDLDEPTYFVPHDDDGTGASSNNHLYPFQPLMQHGVLLTANVLYQSSTSEESYGTTRGPPNAGSIALTLNALYQPYYDSTSGTVNEVLMTPNSSYDSMAAAASGNDGSVQIYNQHFVPYGSGGYYSSQSTSIHPPTSDL
jgi:hypothetical protein